MGSPVAAELATRAGFDWVLIDLEHGVGSEAGLVDMLRAMTGSTTTPIVRVEAAARLRIGRALDLGAGGVMVPQVNDLDTATSMASWLRYPPSGSRGVALSARSSGYGATGHDGVGLIDAAVVGIAQVETRTAVDNVDAIAAVEGIDCLFVGPSDLSHSLGVPGRFGDPLFDAALRRIAEAGARHGTALGVHLPGMSELGRYRDLGFTLLSVGADGSGLLAAFRAMVAGARPTEA
jgi:2-dehydro-3-deoxyglucarate aldolase/4-hydroxy-2-oxoheptanedioate aldolase